MKRDFTSLIESSWTVSLIPKSKGPPPIFFVDAFVIIYNINILLEQKKIFDSKNISQITVKSICEYLFDYTLTNEELEYIYKGSVEWKKEIAMKGKSNILITKTPLRMPMDMWSYCGRIIEEIPEQFG